MHFISYGGIFWSSLMHFISCGSIFRFVLLMAWANTFGQGLFPLLANLGARHSTLGWLALEAGPATNARHVCSTWE